MENLLLDAVWTDDCNGKKNYDGTILKIDTRYWPRGGGFMIFNTDASELGLRGSISVMPEMKPSARSILLLKVNGHSKGGITITERDFEGETFEEVRHQVEEWAQEQMNILTSLILGYFTKASK